MTMWFCSICAYCLESVYHQRSFRLEASYELHLHGWICIVSTSERRDRRKLSLKLSARSAAVDMRGRVCCHYRGIIVSVWTASALITAPSRLRSRGRRGQGRGGREHIAPGCSIDPRAATSPPSRSRRYTKAGKLRLPPATIRYYGTQHMTCRLCRVPANHVRRTNQKDCINSISQMILRGNLRLCKANCNNNLLNKFLQMNKLTMGLGDIKQLDQK